MKRDLYIAALALVRESRKASPSFVARNLGVSWRAAERLIVRMERAGLTSPPSITGWREVLAGPCEIIAFSEARRR